MSFFKVALLLELSNNFLKQPEKSELWPVKMLQKWYWSCLYTHGVLIQ